MSRSVAVGSLVGGIICLGLSIAPIPTKQFALLRTVAAGTGTGILAIGYGAAKSNEQRDREIASQEARIKEEEDFQQQQNLQDKLAIAESRREAIVLEAKQKEIVRVEVAVADYADDVRDAYVVVQDEKGRLDRCLLNVPAEPEPEPEQIPLPEPESEPKTESEPEPETLVALKAKLLKLISEHEGGWIGQLMKKPVLIYGDQGSGKSYFAEFLALCRHYLRGHQIISIADPHFHQNQDECWQCLVKLGVPGFGAHHNYKEVGEQISAMYDRFSKRTLKDAPITSIFDEVTRYGQEEGTIEPAAKLGSKLSSDPRKAQESPILIAHAKTLAALGGGEGFSDAIKGNFIRIKLNSNSEQEPLWRGTISGIKDEDGESIEDIKISIAPDWIRSSWVYELFNSSDETKPETEPEIKLQIQQPTIDNKQYFFDQARKWLDEVHKLEVEATSDTTPWDEAPEVRSEVTEARNSKTSGFTTLLPEDVRSKALARILTLLGEAGSASDEVIALMPTQPDRAVWTGIKLLGKSMTATSRDIFGMGTGGKKFQMAKSWYELLKKEFD